MAERPSKQPFRFRLPWMSSTPAPAPPRAPAESQPPIPPSTQQPPFRPPGSAPSQPSPSTQSQGPPRTDSQPTSLSPSSRATPSQLASQPPSPSKAPLSPSKQPRSPSRKAPPSPSRATPPSPSPKVPPSRLASQPPSPSRTAPPSQTASQPPSPSRTAPPSQTASQPPSPSHTASQSQPAIQMTSLPPSPSGTASLPPSPPRKGSQPVARTSQSPSPSRTGPQEQATARAPSQPSSPLTQAPPSQPTQESTQPSSHIPSQPSSPVTQAPPSQPSQESTQPPSHIPSQPPSPSRLSDSQPKPSPNKTSQGPPALTKPLPQDPQLWAEISFEPVSQSQSQNLMAPTSQADKVAKESSQEAGASTSTEAPESYPLQQPSPPKADESNEEPKTNQESKKKKADEEPKERTITELLSMASGEQAKGHSDVTPQAEQKQLEKQAGLNKKEPTEMGLEVRESKVVNAHPKNRNVGSNSHPKTTISHGEQAALHKEMREDVTKFVHKLTVGHLMQNTDDKPVTVITLAGENRGAAMHVGSGSAKGEGSIPIHRAYKLNQDDNAEATTDGDASSKEQKRINDPKTEKKPETRSYFNSNVQSINNSLLYNSSISEGNPGVHLAFCHIPTESINLKEKTESVEAHKSDFHVTPAQKLTYEPKVRRRCLRGLFLESSDSDPDNPEKPRRHGCRYGCEKKKGKDNETQVSSTK